MGRIAQALKRAQQERSRHSSGSDCELAHDAPLNGSPAAGGIASAGPLAPDEAFPVPPPSPRQSFVISAAPVIPDEVSPEVVVFHDPLSAIAERFRSARTRLVTGNPGGSARVFAVTSSLPREGKTITTANLGFSLAELRHLRVAVIDGDFRNHGLSSVFNVKDKPGLAEVIRGEKRLAEVCIPVVRDNLVLIPAGNARSANPSELLAGSPAAEVFKEIQTRFHYGLIDAPPTNTVADIGMIAPLCHSVVIVIRMSRTPEPLLRRCVRMLQANHVAIAGSILVGYCEKTMAYTDTHDYYEARS